MNDNAGTGVAGAVAAVPQRRGRLRPLLSLWPFAARYRGRIALAFAALLIATLATLAVPLALRRMIDFGFAPDRIGLIDRYFAVMIAVAAVLAVASATRFYLVTTIGERVVADVRAAVFEHITSLSAAFFDTALTGELISRLAADTTQIKSAVGVSVSTALRNMVLFLGSAIMMVVTSPRLSAFVLAVIPVIVLPLVAFGRMVRRRSRTAQDSLADASAYAAELMGAVRTLQAYTNEALAGTRFRAAVERAYQAAVNQGARSAHRDHHLPGVRKRGDHLVGWRAGCVGGANLAWAAWPVRALRRVRSRRLKPAFRCVGRTLADRGGGGANCRTPRRATRDHNTARPGSTADDAPRRGCI